MVSTGDIHVRNLLISSSLLSTPGYKFRLTMLFVLMVGNVSLS